MNQETLKSHAKRILWIDLFKVLAICLVIMGHITPYYNKFIYQFHMAAFFWISGYCTNWENSSKAQIVWKRFCSLMFPFISIFALGTLVMSSLYKSNLYALFYDDRYPWIGIVNAFKMLLKQGNNYVWWLGASWFVSVLFGITILHALLLSLEAKLPRVKHLYLLTFSAIYAIGIYFAKNGMHTRNFDLIMIGQFYYGLGVFCKKKNWEDKGHSVSNIVILILLICNLGLLVIFGNIPYITVDYPARAFRYYVLSILVAINGISSLVCLSKLLSYLIQKNTYIRKCITYVARHTIAIVFFHFIMFKVCIMLLSAANIVPLSYLQEITPSKGDVGQKYLVLFLVISVLGSIALWKLLTFIPGMKFLLGEEKEMYIKIWGAPIAVAIRKFTLNIVVNCKSWLRKFLFEIGESKPLLYCIVFEFIMLSSLIIRQGITLNDDLNFSLVRQTGYMHLLTVMLKNELRMGRPLRLIGGFNWSLAFLTNNVYFNRCIQCLFIGICVIQFSLFIRNLFKNKKIAIVAAVLILTCMPITFEHSAPNAFITLTILPLWHLCISLNNWVNYLRMEEKKYFWWYLITWLIALQGYEFVVTYTPVYILIYLYERKVNVKTLKTAICKCLPPICLGLLYIIATFILGKLVPSQYTGTLLTFVSASSSFEIIKTLALSALPGYFLFNNKYLYLFYLYSNGHTWEIYSAIGDQDIIAILTNGSHLAELGQLVKDLFLLSPANIMRVILLLCIVFGVWKLSQTPIDPLEKQTKFNLWVMFSMLGYILIPSLPNSLSELYQGNVNAVSFTSLPVSMFLFFTACLIISYIICILWTKWKKSAYIHCIVILLLGLLIQAMNIVFANRHEHNFNRILALENLFKSDCIRNLDGATIYAPDLYETRDSLAISDNYWSEIATNQQIDLNFTDDDKAAVKIFYINDEYFCVTTGTELAVLSPHIQKDIFLAATDVDEYVAVQSNIWQYDGSFYCYRFENRGDKLLVLDNENSAFYNYEPSVGTTLQTADTRGMYEDGWCSDNVRIRIDSGDDGKLCFSGWVPEEISSKSGYAISIYCDGQLVQIYPLLEQTIDIMLDLPPDTIVTIDLMSNFTINSTNGDLRELSFILSDIY